MRSHARCLVATPKSLTSYAARCSVRSCSSPRGAAREGADRKARLRCARAEAGEAAAALDAARALQLAPPGEPEHIIALLDRFAAMTTGLGQLGPQ
jgi:hypothetical protein